MNDASSRSMIPAARSKFLAIMPRAVTSRFPNGAQFKSQKPQLDGANPTSS